MAFEAGGRLQDRPWRFVTHQCGVPETISRVFGDERLLPAERDFIREKVLPVIEERRVFIGDALKGRQSTVNELLARHELDREVMDRLHALALPA